MILPAALYEKTEHWLTGDNRRSKELIRARYSRELSGRVLDLCCGIGGFADLARGEYLGVDADAARIERARRLHPDLPRHSFEAADAAALALSERSFDLAMLINALHHLDDNDGARALGLLASVSRGSVVVMEPALETRRPDALFILALDQGRFLRARERQRELIVRAGLRIQEEKEFFERFCFQRIFFCESGGGGN